ncbi:MFS transporter [Cupriavidus sp. 2TAF22]|uniref:MFS transporter n=1 Tax=unclassified Cupriavidus TaxID=2640874 RepID=UPI003F916BFD
MGGLGLLLALVWMRTYFSPAEHPRVTRAEIAHIEAGGALVHLGGKRKSDAPPPRLADIGLLFRSRMLVGIFIAQYCITSITWFFVSWFPSYLVNGRGFSILQAGFVAAVPAICGFIGGVSTGFVSDALLRRTGSLTLARKLPITIGLLLSASMIACNYVDTDWLVIALMSLAFLCHMGASHRERGAVACAQCQHDGDQGQGDIAIRAGLGGGWVMYAGHAASPNNVLPRSESTSRGCLGES